MGYEGLTLSNFTFRSLTTLDPTVNVINLIICGQFLIRVHQKMDRLFGPKF